MYHSVGKGDLFFNVQLEDFVRQMEYLKTKKFNLVSLNQLVEWIEGEQAIPEKTVVLTFDDGYEDNCSNVWPILKKYNFPATIFLAPDLIGKKAGDSKNVVLDMIDWPQIQEMHQSGLIDFQPHGLNHKELCKISLEQVEQEIRGSKNIIEEQLNKTCHFFAYPRGSFNQQVVNILREFGFRAGLSVSRGFVDNNADLFNLPRQSINSQTSMVQFKGKLKFNLKI